MAKFIFSLQSVLDLKIKMETLAKQEFAEAKYALDMEEAKLRNIYDRKTGYEEKYRELVVGNLNVSDIEDTKNAILSMDRFAVIQKQEILKAENFLEEKRVQLENVMIERKTFEKLKEKAFEEFLAETKREESKETDELTSYKYGIKRQVKE